MKNSLSSSLAFSRNGASDCTPLSIAVSDCGNRAMMSHQQVCGANLSDVFVSTIPLDDGCSGHFRTLARAARFFFYRARVGTYDAGREWPPGHLTTQPPRQPAS